MTSRRFLPATEFLRCPFGLDSGLLRGAGHISIDDRFGPSSIARGEFRTGERRATCRRMRVVRDWTREQLDPEDVDFMGTFEPRIEIGFAGAQLVCFHGSPNSYDDILLPDYEGSSLVAFMGEESADLLAGGHTHRQWTRRIGKSLFVNPGGIGFVYDVRIASEEKRGRRGPHLPALAEYAVVIVDETGLGVEFRTVPYSTERLEDIARRSSRPHVAEWIRQWAPS